MVGNATERVSLRELRELSYRALRVTGASHGEAQEAADAVQFAELHGGVGLEAIIAAAGQGWANPHCAITRTQTSTLVVFDVTSTTPLSLLHLGASLVELATSTDRATVVRCSTGELDAIIDLELRLAALRTGHTVCALRKTETDMWIRVATATGALGAWQHNAVTLPGTPSVTIGIGETLVAMIDGDSFGDDPDIRAAEDLNQRRASASRDGITVDVAVWAEVRRIAGGYTQPNKE